MFEKEEEDPLLPLLLLLLLLSVLLLLVLVLVLVLRLTSWQGTPSTAENQASAGPVHRCATCCE